MWIDELFGFPLGWALVYFGGEGRGGERLGERGGEGGEAFVGYFEWDVGYLLVWPLGTCSFLLLPPLFVTNKKK